MITFAYHSRVFVMYMYVMACTVWATLLSPVICLPLYIICYKYVCYGKYSVSYTAVSCHLLTTLQYLLCIYVMSCSVWATLLSPVICLPLYSTCYVYMLWHVQCDLHRCLLSFAYHSTVFVTVCIMYVMACTVWATLLSPVICLPLYSICYVNVCYGMYSVSYTAVSCHLLTTLQYL